MRSCNAPQMAERQHSVRVDGGRIDVWLRDDGLYGVSLLPDEGQPGHPGHSYTSTEDIEGFPPEYDQEALEVWGRAQWAERAVVYVTSASRPPNS